jgi:heme-degrading monooxygenase HmoA
MFARVITAQAGIQGFDSAIRLFREQLPGARRLPGFTGFYLLTDPATGKLMVISLWDTREHMDAVTAQAGPSGIRPEAGTGLTALHLETYEVTAHGATD